MTNWQWLALGAVAGYLVARTGTGLGGNFSISAGVGARGARVPGSGATPLDQPTGSENYRAVGAYNPLYGAGFPELINPADNARLVNGNEVS